MPDKTVTPLAFKVFEHSAALIGRAPWEVSRDGELLFQAQAAAFRLYRHQPLIVAIDHYNLAPEAYGGVVTQPDGHGVPAITEPLLASADDLLRVGRIDPSRDGRFPMILEVASRLKREFPAADVAVPVDGPFSIASALVGFDRLLCDVAEDPDAVRAALMHLVAGQVGLTEQAKARGLGVAFAESAAGPPLLSPALFRRVELPVLKTLLGRMGEILVRVNMHSGLVARGSWDEIRAEADRVLAIVRTRPNTLVGAGVLPYETTPENISSLRDYLASDRNRTGIPP